MNDTVATAPTLSLYNKYRPKTFDEVVGQDIAVTTMKNALMTGRTANAYLFSGQRGVGKTSTARIFARSLLCRDRGNNIDPCGGCASCRCFERDGESPDFIEIDAASNRGVAEIRSLMERLSLSPQISERKVVLIDEVHLLTREAVSALLKVLEEPPSGVVFLLATTEPNKIPDTIRSRCVWLRFRPLTSEEMSKHLSSVLQREGVACEDGVCDLVARQSGGGLRDALSMLDQLLVFSGGTEITLNAAQLCVGRVDDSIVCSLVDVYLSGNLANAVGFTVRRGVDDVKDLLITFGDLVSNAIIRSQVGEIVGDGKLLGESCRDAVETMAEKKTLFELLCMRNALERHMWKVDEAAFDSHHVFNEIMIYGMSPEYDAFDHNSVSRILNGVTTSYREIRTISKSTIMLIELIKQVISNQETDEEENE